MSPATPGQIINALPSGKFANLGKVNPSGTLECRKLASTTMLYWRVTLGGKTTRVVIGPYDSAAPVKSLQPTDRGYSVKAAERAAEAMAALHHTHRAAGGFVGVEEKRLADAKAAKLKSEALARNAKENTLAALLDAYCARLEKLGRTSHKNVRSLFRLHVLEVKVDEDKGSEYAELPKYAALPANEVTSEQIANLMRYLVEAGKGRTSNKLRSYVRSAYQTAKASRSKAGISARFKAFNITDNPAADTQPDETHNKPDKNPLNAAEMRAYWQTIKAMPGFKGAVLRLHLLTGGQRIEQLVRLQTKDINVDATDAAATAITLYDSKGRPGKHARPHVVPLVPLAVAALTECKPGGEFALSTDGGNSHIANTTLSNWASAAAVGIADFQAKRIRSGVETLLASARISSEWRGRLQSHGVSGVQARHYDGHGYMDEKREALETLFRLLDTPTASNVKQIRKRAA